MAPLCAKTHTHEHTQLLRCVAKERLIATPTLQTFDQPREQQLYCSEFINANVTSQFNSKLGYRQCGGRYVGYASTLILYSHGGTPVLV